MLNASGNTFVSADEASQLLVLISLFGDRGKEYLDLHELPTDIGSDDSLFEYTRLCVVRESNAALSIDCIANSGSPPIEAIDGNGHAIQHRQNYNTFGKRSWTFVLPHPASLRPLRLMIPGRLELLLYSVATHQGFIDLLNNAPPINVPALCARHLPALEQPHIDEFHAKRDKMRTKGLRGAPFDLNARLASDAAINNLRKIEQRAAVVPADRQGHLLTPVTDSPASSWS